MNFPIPKGLKKLFNKKSLLAILVAIIALSSMPAAHAGGGLPASDGYQLVAIYPAPGMTFGNGETITRFPGISDMRTLKVQLQQFNQLDTYSVWPDWYTGYVSITSTDGRKGVGNFKLPLTTNPTMDGTAIANVDIGKLRDGRYNVTFAVRFSTIVFDQNGKRAENKEEWRGVRTTLVIQSPGRG